MTDIFGRKAAIALAIALAGRPAFHEPCALEVARNVRPPWHGPAYETNTLHGDRAIAELVIA
jgi:hypothetical protein